MPNKSMAFKRLIQQLNNKYKNIAEAKYKFKESAKYKYTKGG